MRIFSPESLAVIGAFARQMGLPPVARADAPVSFAFSHWGKLTLIMADDTPRVLVFLERATHCGGAARERALLERAGLDAARGWFVHAGLADDGSPIAFISIDAESFDLVTLGAALDHLHETLEAAGIRA